MPNSYKYLQINCNIIIQFFLRWAVIFLFIGNKEFKELEGQRFLLSYSGIIIVVDHSTNNKLVYTIDNRGHLRGLVC